MRQTLRQSAHETRAILADVSVSQTHPSTAEKPEAGATSTKRIMHAMHVALMKTGQLANKSHERKTPQWPLRGESISILGYGAEKVVYRVVDEASASDSVVGVYHLKSMQHTPAEVVTEKKANYETYKKYFGDIVLPTSFVILDNPWGDGAKPASIQTFVQGAEKLSDLDEETLRERAATDTKFAKNLGHLTCGYGQMMQDGLRPDFASSNVLVHGSEIIVFDTGVIYPADRDSEIIKQSPNYQLIERLTHSLIEK